MRFTVEAGIFELFPGLRLVVAAASGIDNRGEAAGTDELARDWRETWRSAPSLTADFPDRQSHPRIRAWRNAWKRIGLSSKKFPASAESVLKRALKGGDPFSINPVVDFYNTISLRYLAPAGAFDIDALESGTLELRPTRSGDRFHALDAPEPERVAPGEVAYATGSTILTRHFVWKQSRQALVEHSTHRVFLVSEILGDLAADVAASVQSDFQRGLRSYFGVDSESTIMGAGGGNASWIALE